MNENDEPREPSVLCVDDEPAVLSALRRTLRRESFDVVTASDASVALDCLDRHPVDVVIADERMPRMSGSELLEEVHRRWPWMGLVILTGYPGQNVMIRGLEAKVDFLLHKPWDDESLRRTIRRLVQEVERTRSGEDGSVEPPFDVGGSG
jgi:DNA-binding response OmpR family regulator